eukprot:5220570-Pleurochrysis_carterae.AAC.1
MSPSMQGKNSRSSVRLSVLMAPAWEQSIKNLVRGKTQINKEQLRHPKTIYKEKAGLEGQGVCVGHKNIRR